MKKIQKTEILGIALILTRDLEMNSMSGVPLSPFLLFLRICSRFVISVRRVTADFIIS